MAKPMFVAALLAAAAERAPAQDTALRAVTAPANDTAPEFSAHVSPGALLRAEVATPVKWSRVASGTVLDATLSAPLYDGERAVMPSGTPLRVTVASSKKERTRLGFWKKAARVIVRAFNPLERDQLPEYRVTLSGAELLPPGGDWTTVNVSVLRAGPAVIVNPQKKGRAQHGDASGKALAAPAATGAKKKSSQVLLLRLEDSLPLPPSSSAAAKEASAPLDHARGSAYLLNPLSASQNHEGDKFQAALAEPVHFGDRVFEPGSLLEGTVVRRSPPRMLSRAGKLYLRVDRVIAQNWVQDGAPNGAQSGAQSGQDLRVSGTLSGAEADARSQFVLDEEGALRGRKPGVTNALVDLGISYVLGKASDDIAETPIRAVGASMSDAAVANAARYVGLAGAITYLVTRRGRDVRLPKYSEIQVDFARANPAVASSPGAPVSAVAPGSQVAP